jgi:predicted DNA binding CopG/RHH family protein
MFWCDQNLEKASRWSKKAKLKMTNKGGRPRLSASQKKKYKVDVKMSTEDYYTLKSKARLAGMTNSEYMRQCIHTSSVKERLKPEHQTLIRQLCGMANNLNQIARKANAHGYDNARTEYLYLAEQIDQLLNQL